MRTMSPNIEDAYFEKFARPIPLGLWHGDEEWLRAEQEAIRALAGERGPLEASEFPLDCPPGAVL